MLSDAERTALEMPSTAAAASSKLESSSVVFADVSFVLGARVGV